MSLCCISARSRIVVYNYYYGPQSERGSERVPLFNHRTPTPSAQRRARDLALHSTLSHSFCPWRPHGQVLTSEWPLGDLRMPAARPPPPPLKVTGTRLLLGRCTPAVRPLPPERESLPLAGSFICSVCFLIRSVFLPGFSVLSLSSPLLFPEFDFSWSCQSDAPGP